MRSFLVEYLTSKRCSVFLELNYPFRRAPTLLFLNFPKNRKYPCLMRINSAEIRCIDAGRFNYDRTIETIDGGLRGILLSSRRGSSGSDNFQCFSRMVMHSRSYLSGTVRRNWSRGTPEAVRNKTTSRSPQNHKNGVESYKTIFRWAKQN